MGGRRDFKLALWDVQNGDSPASDPPPRSAKYLRGPKAVRAVPARLDRDGPWISLATAIYGRIETTGEDSRWEKIVVAETAKSMKGCGQTPSMNVPARLM